MKRVKILGSTYKVYVNVPYTKDPSLEGRFGYTSFPSRKIVVADIRTVPGWEDVDDYEAENTFAQTMRHEVIHAYLLESGLNGSSSPVDCWARNEEMVDWFAIQMPKMINTFNELGV
ncbi:MAG: hypothetical protein IKW20_05880 [Bacteroidales bacterium]|nr:hypothetical protein [Bacteroidales bacterium]